MIIVYLKCNIYIYIKRKLRKRKTHQVLTISAWHILALSLSNRVLPGADNPVEELRHKVQYLLHAENVKNNENY